MKIDTSPEALAALKEELYEYAPAGLAREVEDVIAALEAQCREAELLMSNATTALNQQLDLRREIEAELATVKESFTAGTCKNCLQVQAERDAALAALRAYGQHHPTCRSMVYLLSNPPQRQTCDCGLAALAEVQ